MAVMAEREVTGVSSARLYWENKLPFFAAVGVTIPVGVSTFADEIYRGGHFAAWEQPELLSEDVRATFRSLR